MAQDATPYERLREAGLLPEPEKPLDQDQIDLLNDTLNDEDVDRLIDVGTRLKQRGASPGIRF